MDRYERLWERLLEYLAEWATVHQADFGLELTFEQAPGVERTVELVITEDQWEDYISVIYGTGDPRATPLRKHLLGMPADVDYLVYDRREYELEPRTARALPREEEVIVDGVGRWQPMDPDGPRGPRGPRG